MSMQPRLCSTKWLMRLSALSQGRHFDLLQTQPARCRSAHLLPTKWICWLCAKSRNWGAGRQHPSQPSLKSGGCPGELRLIPAQLCPSTATSLSHRAKAFSCLLTVVCIMPICVHLCLYEPFCLCFAVTQSLGLFDAHTRTHLYLCCLGLLLSLACTKDSFQWMASRPCWFLQS